MNSNHTKTQPVKQNPKYSLSQGDFATFINWIQVGHGLTCKTYENSVHHLELEIKCAFYFYFCFTRETQNI